MLEILNEVEPSILPCGREHRQVRVRCTCGKEFVSRRQRIVSGTTKSCGCLMAKAVAKSNKERATHGMSTHDLYHVWFEMMTRCYQRTSENYARYGARGIKVYKQWHYVDTFIPEILKLLGPRPPQMELDRINNDKGYFPGNLRWATIKQQARNRRSNAMLEIDGQVKCLAEWAEIFDVHRSTLARRYAKGWRGELLVKGKQ